MPTRIEVNCETGEVQEIELTAAEIKALEDAAKAEAAAIQAAKDAAHAKLAALGLTPEEIAALSK